MLTKMVTDLWAGWQNLFYFTFIYFFRIIRNAELLGWNSCFGPDVWMGRYKLSSVLFIKLNLGYLDKHVNCADLSPFRFVSMSNVLFLPYRHEHD